MSRLNRLTGHLSALLPGGETLGGTRVNTCIPTGNALECAACCKGVAFLITGTRHACSDQLINIRQPGFSRLSLSRVLPPQRLSASRDPYHQFLDLKERSYETSRVDAHGTRSLRDGM